ncbi:oligosaccharide flippase family protein [Paenibacillus sp. J5C_2022]|uniref:lipopolysaccharide biosynthesis protein n=1 Tax=Paenibacillus sp. J5C2022 TaxID=2977129 RepID=UPI0021D2FE07|nr:oligosaccharide flippase family protein [Paenibacillus sp. J5C2022]MCU6710290.1 oligosaccharide flippase family protein [Paenibacillus sp. J5C2022]
MRVKSSLLNITAGLGNQIVIAGLSFLTRTVFIHSLGIEYLGINALFTSILAMLAIAESGIGSSIIYSLYKPVAQDDRPRIIALMNLYRKAYWIIAGVILLVGLALMPFLHLFVKDTSVDHLHMIYSIFLMHTALPYLFVYKHSFLNVNQKNYMITLGFTISAVLSTGIRLAILHYTENYLLYLIAEAAISLATSYILALLVDRKYPFLKEGTNYKLDDATKAQFKKNMKAILLQNIGNYFIFGVDSVLISSFISVVAVGLYSNYKLLIELCRNFANQIFSNLYHSIGNLVAQESREKVYSIFQVSMLVNFLLYAFLAIMLYLFVEPLIKVWIGNQFVMDQWVLLLLVITFYERGMRNTITTIKTTSGIFHEDRFAPVIQAAINLTISIVFVHTMGIAGIFLGTLISSLLVPFWLTPYLVYKNVFQRTLLIYYAKYGYYTGVALLTTFLVNMALHLLALPDDSFLWLIVQAVVAAVCINLIFICVFYRSEEFKYLLNISKTMLGKLVSLKSASRKNVVSDQS